MFFIPLTEPDGNVIHVRADSVIQIAEYTLNNGCKYTKVSLGNKEFLRVCETPQEVISRVSTAKE